MVLMCSNEKIDNLSFATPSSKVQKAEAVAQIDGVLVVRLANGRFLTSARDFHKWAYMVSHDLTLREPVIRGLAAIGYITNAEADEHMAEHRRAKAHRDEVYALKQLMARAEELGIAGPVAQAIEARQGGNGEAGAVHESAVGATDAPKPSQHTPENHHDR